MKKRDEQVWYLQNGLQKGTIELLKTSGVLGLFTFPRAAQKAPKSYFQQHVQSWSKEKFHF